jgi:hypothetical protein
MRTLDHAVFAAKFGRGVLKIRNPLKIIGFLMGNILPDYSFHTYCKGIGHGFSTARKKLALAWKSRQLHGEGVIFYFRLGIAAHYLCDSFTFPHNRGFKGSLAAHIRYENIMHCLFRRESGGESSAAPIFDTPESCMRFLESLHKKYIRQPFSTPSADLRRIAFACRTALLSSLSIPENYDVNIGKILRA